MAYMLAMRRRYFQRGPDSFESLRRNNDMDLLSMLLPHRQRNFAGHPDKCPAEALPRNKALQVGGMLGSSAAVMAIQAKDWHAFGPPSMPEGGPRRTRRLRHGLSQNTERPCSNTCKGFRLHEILPPDVLRHSRSQAVVRRRRGGGQYAVLLPFANTLQFSNERPFRFRSSALVDKLVMNSIFIVNMFFQRAKNFF